MHAPKVAKVAARWLALGLVLACGLTAGYALSALDGFEPDANGQLDALFDPKENGNVFSVTLPTTTPTPTPLQLNTAVSRKTHGGAGDFDIPLPLQGAPGVECRSSGGAHTIVFTFNNQMLSGNASVSAGTGSVAGSPIFANNTMTVHLTGVADVQTLTLALINVRDVNVVPLPPTSVSLSLLPGDTNGDGIVNAGDALQTRSRSGQGTAAANFRSDVNADGFINSGDTIAVRSRSGSVLP